MQQTNNNKLVLFIDLLGFKNFVCDNEIEHIEKIKSVLNIFSQNFIEERPYDILFGKAGEVKKHVSIFSDSVIITIEDTSQEQKYLLGIIEDIALQICQCQNLLYEFKLLIRGGLALGNIYHEKDICFGSALINAYKLESEKAIYPRIIINEAIIIFLKRIKGDNFNQLETEFISKDDEGLYYIDYAKLIISHQNSTDMFNRFSEAIHFKPKKEKSKKEILSLLEEQIRIITKADVRAKYEWLRNQFDK